MNDSFHISSHNPSHKKIGARQIWLRIGFFILLAGAIYVVTFLILNGPAYWQKVKYVAAGNDLSNNLKGQYLDLDYLDQLEQADNQGGQPPEQAGSATSSAPVIHYNDTGSTAGTSGNATKIPFIDPNAFVKNTVTIPRIGVRAPLIDIQVNTQKAQQKGLEQGVVHIAGTPKAGQEGNAFYAGHSSDYLFKPGHYKTVFALLPELRKNDYFILSNDKQAYYYKINEVVITSPKDTSVLERGGPGKKFASLQTSYPVGTALKRFVVVGQLVKTINHYVFMDRD